MSDFNSIKKRLVIYPTREITDNEAANASPRLTKFHTQRKPARDIKTIYSTITILRPLCAADMTYYRLGYVCRQHNFSTTSNFSILSFKIVDVTGFPGTPWGYEGMSNSFITIKYRVGNSVYRYLLRGRPRMYSTLFDYVYHPRVFEEYTNQLIKKNFCIEIWCNKQEMAAFPIDIPEPTLTMSLSMLSVPETGDETEVAIDSVDDLTPTDMALAIPFDVGDSLDNSKAAHLDNI